MSIDLSVFETEGTHILGAGTLYFDPYDLDANAYEGEVDLGEVPNFAITIDSEEVERWSSKSKTAEKLASTTTRITRAMSMTLDEMNPYNLSLFYSGDIAIFEQDAETAESDVLTVLQGRTYVFGRDGDHPIGRRNVTNVVVTDGDSTTYDLNDDYTLDAANGTITILRGGDIDDEDDITITWNQPDAEWLEVSSGATVTRRGRLRFQANNSDGRNYHLHFASVSLRPSGEMSLMSREEYASFELEGEILQPTSGPAVRVASAASNVPAE